MAKPPKRKQSKLGRASPEPAKPEPAKPELVKPVRAPPVRNTPARHRILRCERCRTYLFDIFLVRCDPGTETSFIVTMKCRNKRCRRTNQVSVDLVNPG
jgi:hypothetical protein